jgi:hypothetical protein
MSKPCIDPSSLQTVKTFFQGFFGALTFGAYNQYNFNKIMEQNNELIKKTNEFNELKHQEEIRILKEHIKFLENKSKSSWW